ncbi:MAG: PQQ-binding-like beta-propeller repeat protein [Pirellulales bacterium]|nr:PQQ-binding-like beta-propeller repeat protein [Pirellulales bacterium]
MTIRPPHHTMECTVKSTIISTYAITILSLLSLLYQAPSPALAASGNQKPTAQLGGSSERNNVSEGKNIPTEWNVGSFDRKTGDWKSESAKNIKWVARLGSQTYGTPIVAGSRIFCATNNGAGWLKRFPAKLDLGCLLCFSRDDGRFQWQYSCKKLAAGRAVDWPLQGICSSPLVEGDRLWVVDSRGCVVCLDTEGFDDGENDGPFSDEESTDKNEADVIWSFDMMKELGILQHNMCSCSVTSAGELLFVNTSNGVDDSHENVPAPKAPSFIALEKKTGKLVWADASPGANILHGQWSSAACGTIDGIRQAIFAGGDGWIYSFAAEPTSDGKAKLLWKFDCNAKESVWEGDGQGDRASIISTPVIHQGLVYIMTGHDPEFGEAPGRLWCIDPTKRGDVSPEIVVDKEGKPIPTAYSQERRTQAVNKEAGETVKKNSNSAAVWLYEGKDSDGDGELGFEESMHRGLGTVAIKDGLLFVADLAGLFHCVDAKTGKPHWAYDMLAAVWGSPLIVDGKVYLGDEDGDVVVFELSPKQKLLAENNVGDSVYSTPVVHDGVLYISTRSRLIAIAAK